MPTDININERAQELHNGWIAQYGLRQAVDLARELHRRIEATLQDQQARHPEEWGKNLPPIPRIPG